MPRAFINPCLEPDSGRRSFLQQLLVLGSALGLGGIKTGNAASQSSSAVPILSGSEFFLTIAETPVNFTGASRFAVTVNGSLPGPILRWREGDTVTLHVSNQLSVISSIHWHGIILPFDMDGAPGISFAGIPPGSTFSYQFKVRQNGTYWYHSHSGMQEQSGLYGAIIIDPAVKTIQAERDYVVQLSDWTDENPLAVFDKLKKQSDYYNFNQPTAIDFFRDVIDSGWSAAIDKRSMWNEMRMSMTDLADISAYTYTYLINGHTNEANWTGLFTPGERVRLRLINSGAQTFFDVRIPGLAMTVVQVDGQNVEPVSVDELRIGSAESYDVIVTPTASVYTLFAQSMDRSGYVHATLATQTGMSAAIPAIDQAQPLTMLDMMGDMGDHSQAPHSAGMHHPAPGSSSVHHAVSEFGANVDMRVDTPRTNLDDPGIGLRDNGRKVLTYADLHTIGGSLDNRKPEREIEMHLTGNMERYSWSIDGVEYAESSPIHFRYGERLRVIIVNDTMMSHPLHLHGMWSELETPEGEFLVRKHTIAVQPAQRITFLVTADAKGRWPWHCHLFYHMHAGMMREVVVA